LSLLIETGTVTFVGVAKLEEYEPNLMLGLQAKYLSKLLIFTVFSFLD